MSEDIFDIDVNLDDEAIDQVVPERIDTGDLCPQTVGDLSFEKEFSPIAVELDKEGRLSTSSVRESEFRKIIEKGVQRSELLPTAAGWAVFRANTTPEEPPNARAKAETLCEVVMAGQMGIAGIGIMEIVGFLGDSRETGILTGSVDEVERSVFLRDGDVVGTRSTDPDERLGALLIRMGKLTPRELDAALAHGSEDGQRLGQSCVTLKFLTSHVLWEMVKLQHVEIFERLISMERGLWHFRRASPTAMEASAVHLPTQYLLMDAVRKLDEVRMYREAIPSFDAVISLHADVDISDIPEKLPPRVIKLAEDLYWTLTDNQEGPGTGRRAYIRDIAARISCTDFELSQLLFHLLNEDLIELHELAPREPSSAFLNASSEDSVLLLSAENLRAVLKIYARAMQEIFAESHLHNDAKRLVEALRAYIVDDDVELPPSIRMMTVNEDGRLNGAELLSLLQSYPMGQMELCAALDTVLFFVLFEATETLGTARSEDLVRRVQMIRSLLPKEPV